MDASLISRLGQVRTNISAIDQQLNYERPRLHGITPALNSLRTRKAELIKAVGTIDRAISVVSANGIGKIEGMVTDGLRRVFGSEHIGLVIEKKETARRKQLPHSG